MEFSPLAQKKLAEIGDLSPEEKERFRLSEEIRFLMSDYFTNKVSIEEMWMQLRKLRDEGKEFLIGEAQLRLVNAISLLSNDNDYERCRSALLGCETLKEQNRYQELELHLNTLESLRRKFREERDSTFNSLKSSFRSQVAAAAKQVAEQSGNRNVAVDIEGSVEASVKASPQWKEFIEKHEQTYLQRFDECTAKMKGLISIAL